MPSPLKLLQEAGLVRHNLIAFALLTAAFNGIVTASIGSWIAQSYSDYHSRRLHVQTIADLIYERHTRARLILSSIRRGADLDELRYRKRTYDEVFVEWNKKIQNNVLPIREALGKADATVFETMMQTLLVPAFGELDTCLTKVYDLKLAGQDTTTLLDFCQRKELSEFILSCGSGITDELYRFTRISLVLFGRFSTNEQDAAQQRIRTACAKPAGSSIGSPMPVAPLPIAPQPPASQPPAPLLRAQPPDKAG